MKFCAEQSGKCARLILNAIKAISSCKQFTQAHDEGRHGPDTARVMMCTHKKRFSQRPKSPSNANQPVKISMRTGM